MRNSDRRFRESKVWLISFVLSVMLHLTLSIYWWGEEIFTLPAADNQGVDNSGDQSELSVIRVVRIQPPAQNQVVRPVTPRIVLEVLPSVEMEVIPSIEVSSPFSDVLGYAKERSLLTIPTAGNQGLGARSTPTTPPLPRGIVVPQFIGGLDIEEIEIGVFIDEEGRVVSDSTRIVSPTMSSSFYSQLIEQATEWIFDPATRAGKAVSSWFFYTIRM